MNSSKKIAIFGSGPAGLMAASQVAAAGVPVDVFERRPSLGRKLLVAGSSGLNISYSAPVDELAGHYRGFTPYFWNQLLQQFGPKEWIGFVESMGFETFVGTSSRYFLREMKAAGFLKAWTEKLRELGVTFYTNHEWQSCHEFTPYAAVGFALGGGSWEDQTPSWIEKFRNDLKVKVSDFYPTNVGYEVDWSLDFLKEAEGKPLKNIVLKTAQAEKAGELVVTKYGLEGTPIYFLGAVGTVYLDLKPAMTESEILADLQAFTENLSPIRRIKKKLSLCEASLALLFHHTTTEQKADLRQMVKLLKAFPVRLLRPRPLVEAISSGGGLSLDEISIQSGQELMLKKHPGVFCAGEMMDWSAPTGGFLIQGCISQGALMAKSMLNYLTQY